MDAILLLGEVSPAYRGLKSLAVEAVVVTESGDEDLRRREEQRVRFFYKAPDRIRYEPCGKKGTVEVNDGEHPHACFLLPGGGARYHKTPAAEMRRLPHRFRPEFPLSNELRKASRAKVASCLQLPVDRPLHRKRFGGRRDELPSRRYASIVIPGVPGRWPFHRSRR